MSKTITNDNRHSRSYTPQNKEELKQKKPDETHVRRNRRSKVNMLPDVFDERKVLVRKWFDKWNDNQRLTVLEDLINHCRIQQLEQLNHLISQQKPTFRNDFTHVLPRFLSLYIFAYLDPRSLSRCAQVSWHWKSLVDHDELWVPLCRRLGWTLSYVPSPFERGPWKRLYLDSIILLKQTVTPTLRGMKEGVKEMEGLSLIDGHQSRQRSSVPVTDQRPPWKGSDPTPRDIWRHNYLENDETVGKSGNVKTDGRRKTPRVKMSTSAVHRSNSLTRSRSTTFIRDITDNDFATWAQFSGSLVGGAPFVARPLTSDLGVGPTIAFDRGYGTALITSGAEFGAAAVPLKPTVDKNYDMTVY